MLSPVELPPKQRKTLDHDLNGNQERGQQILKKGVEVRYAPD